MAKPPKKKPKVRPDFAQNAFRVMQEATGQAPKTPDPDAGKDPAAVARGKKGGAKGGKARGFAVMPPAFPVSPSAATRRTSRIPR